MSTLQMLDVAIGMVMIFLLLSLICTALGEVIEAIFKYRASDLEKGVKQLLQESEETHSGKVSELYNHSLISSLYKGPYKPGSRRLPSYIPATNFALALMDLLLPATSQNLSGSVGGGKFTPDGTPAPQHNPMALAPIREAVENWPASNSRQAILTLIDNAGNDVDKARINFEGWFNTSMDRVAGWYKRRTQKILILLGFLLAFAMNADTIAIFKSLLNDPPLRNSLVSAAQEYASGKDPTSGTPEERVDANAKKIYSLRLPIGWDWNQDSLNKKYLSNYASAIP
jgi:hypothetical protein